MKVRRLIDVSPRSRRVAIGNFDGVHLGHAAIIDGCDSVLTFEPHPLTVLEPDRAPNRLTTLETKAQLIAELGVEELVVMPFNRATAQQSPRQFVDEVLISRLGAIRVSVGENFRYGANGRGDVAGLRAASSFTTIVAGLVRVEGGVVSSSRVRAALEAGDVELARRLLGRPHRLVSRVILSAPATPGRPVKVRVRFDPADARPLNGRYRCRVWLPDQPNAATDAEVYVDEHATGRLRLTDSIGSSSTHLVVEFLEGGLDDGDRADLIGAASARAYGA